MQRLFYNEVLSVSRHLLSQGNVELFPSVTKRLTALAATVPHGERGLYVVNLEGKSKLKI